MKCCIACFESAYLANIISQDNNKGDCDYCETKDTFICESSKLISFFKGILDLFIVDADGDDIGKLILSTFNNKVFSEKLISKGKVNFLIQDIVKNEMDYYIGLSKNKVKFKISNEKSQKLSVSWDRFSEEIKNENRFHLKNSLDLKNLADLFLIFKKEIAKGALYYRARISSDSYGFPKDKMANPPNSLAKAGRANPEGISYLYLAKKNLTGLYEVRASLFDYVTVARFELQENISVINLSEYDVFALSENETLEELTINLKFIEKLERELSKPRRRYDSELDYLPTQYLSEWIKSIGYDGIEFRSSLHKNGINLTIFNPSKFEALDVAVYDIIDSQFQYEKLS